MKDNKFLMAIGFLLLLMIAAGSCKKSDDVSYSFTWTYGSNNHVAIEAEARLPGTITTIYTIFGGSVISADPPTPHSTEPGPWFFPGSFNVGSYVLDSASQNMYYRDSYDLHFPVITGTLNITANTNDRLSGDFSVIVRDLVGQHVPVAGSFTNIPVTRE